MYIKKEMCFDDLKKNSWSGAVDTLNTIEENDKKDELMEYLEVIFGEDVPDETSVNDYLWFESDEIFEYLGIEETSEEE